MEYAVVDDDGYALTTTWGRATYDSGSVPIGFRYVRQAPISSNPKYDPLRVRQIARNLLANAYRYGGPEIRVTIHQFEDDVVLSVADIGLGLMSRYLAEAMNGTLTCDGVDGETRFDLRLPVDRQGRRGPR
jgi:signal transduction histidine kinase